jgi:hypothetical protein
MTKETRLRRHATKHEDEELAEDDTLETLQTIGKPWAIIWASSILLFVLAWLWNCVIV